MKYLILGLLSMGMAHAQTNPVRSVQITPYYVGESVLKVTVNELGKTLKRDLAGKITIEGEGIDLTERYASIPDAKEAMIRKYCTSAYAPVGEVDFVSREKGSGGRWSFKGKAKASKVTHLSFAYRVSREIIETLNCSGEAN